jgi:hypothetical protein
MNTMNKAFHSCTNANKFCFSLTCNCLVSTGELLPSWGAEPRIKLGHALHGKTTHYTKWATPHPNVASLTELRSDEDTRRRASANDEGDERMYDSIVRMNVKSNNC